MREGREEEDDNELRNVNLSSAMSPHWVIDGELGEFKGKLVVFSLADVIFKLLLSSDKTELLYLRNSFI